jgi:hypothetical protein
MKRKRIVVLGLAAAGVALVASTYRSDLVALASRAMLQQPATANDERADLLEIGVSLGRTPLESERAGPEHSALPEGRETPSSEQELAEFVAWLRSLGHEELLRLSNAEFDFEKSELVEMLMQLQGEWVVPALGGLAVTETDPLLKAILVEGLVGSLNFARGDDERMLPILDSLMTQMSLASEDPHDVARSLATFAYMVCARGDQDYVLLMGAHLAASDNSGFLMHGYLHMGSEAGGEATLKEMLSAHPNPDGRLGALEGLRQTATAGRTPPGEITTLGLAALETETDEGNRLLLYEMMISTGGEEALTAVEQMLRAGQVSEIGKTVELLALKMEPARAQALFQDLLRDHELEGAAKQAMYNAMGLVPGEGGADFLLGLAKNGELDGAERLAGLRGLWNRPVNERLAGELRDVFATTEDSALRTEALRMLVYGESAGSGIDLREVAALDEDPAVRAEAVQMAAMQPSENTREWLEERLFQDSSFDVKAAALGALVYQAHYTGDGDRVLGYLERARKYTDDEQALAMIAEGERMVKDYDPRNLDLRLAEEAEFLGTIAQYTEGPASRSFQRQAKQLGQIVGLLRATRDGRRPAR